MGFFSRTVDIDDAGSGTNGTPHDNSWLQAIYTAIENAFTSRSTITTTGNQTAINSGLVRWLYCNNATLLTIQGMTAGVEGQRVFIVSTGAGQVDIANQNATATEANRIICGVTGTISLAAGSGRCALEYDATASRWRVIQHEQGAWISPTFSAGNYTGNGAMTWTVASGDVITCAYYLDGRQLRVAFYLGSTDVGGTPNTALQIAIPGGFTAQSAALNAMVHNDAGAGNTLGFCQVLPGATLIQCSKNDLSTWATSTNATGVQGQLSFEVQ